MNCKGIANGELSKKNAASLRHCSCVAFIPISILLVIPHCYAQAIITGPPPPHPYGIAHPWHKLLVLTSCQTIPVFLVFKYRPSSEDVITSMSSF